MYCLPLNTAKSLLQQLEASIERLKVVIEFIATEENTYSNDARANENGEIKCYNCNREPISVVLLPCKHQAICLNCRDARELTHCPIKNCNTEINATAEMIKNLPEVETNYTTNSEVDSTNNKVENSDKENFNTEIIDLTEAA